MSSPLNTYRYFGKIDFDPSLLDECKNLLTTHSEQIPIKHEDGLYKEFEPIQCGFRKKKIERFEINGIDTENSSFQLILQHPGRMLPWHIDKFELMLNVADYSKVRTYLCFLTDWVPGQIFGTEYDTYTNWKAGDTICWDYLVWHFSSNSSLESKYTLQIAEMYN